MDTGLPAGGPTGQRKKLSGSCSWIENDVYSVPPHPYPCFRVLVCECVTWPERSPDLNPLDLFLWGKPEINYLQESADWHGRLHRKVFMLLFDHWCVQGAVACRWMRGGHWNYRALKFCRVLRRQAAVFSVVIQTSTRLSASQQIYLLLMLGCPIWRFLHTTISRKRLFLEYYLFYVFVLFWEFMPIPIVKCDLFSIFCVCHV